MQCHHDIAMKELEEEAQEAGEGQGIFEDAADKGKCLEGPKGSSGSSSSRSPSSIQALSAPVLPTASSGIPAGQEEKGEERSPSDAAPANQQERLEEVQRDDTYDAQRADDQEGPSTSIQANKSGKRKCSRRGELLVETEPLARRQQAKVDYSGAQGRQEPSKQRK
ncbi:unnamed protein product [Caenorhabditis nigoni]